MVTYRPCCFCRIARVKADPEAAGERLPGTPVELEETVPWSPNLRQQHVEHPTASAKGHQPSVTKQGWSFGPAKVLTKWGQNLKPGFLVKEMIMGQFWGSATWRSTFSREPPSTSRAHMYSTRLIR